MGSGNQTPTAEETRDLVMKAAERCITKYGVRKTTMHDIAREAGMSRPNIYRFFDDRDTLLDALTESHSHALVERAHSFLAQQESFEDAIVEGLLYLADHGRRDPFTRLLIAPEETEFARRFRITDTAANLAAEFWAEFLDEAERSGHLRKDLDRPMVHAWLASVGLMLMSLLEQGETPDWCRELVRKLVVPGLVDPH